jgi:N-acetylated-alpha-linked acidic dipeptidase
MSGMLVGLLLLAMPGVVSDPPMQGFTAEGARAQRALEARFDAVLSADSMTGWMRRMSARPHHVGSPHGKANAEFMADLFRSWGYEVAIERFDVLFPTPRERVLELTGPTRYRARLAEPAVEGDATSRITQDVLPTYNAYSVDGDVTGELVYVNYGVPADYEVLARHGVDVKGRIVIARYGGSWRGIKPKVAAEHGAIGCIIYSDPRDDGYGEGVIYPEGAFRPPFGAQRGSVADMPLYPGDPLTPGVGATPEATRLPRESAPTLTKIPVLPIGYADAQPLLAALRGAVVPQEWRGGLPITYRMGPGPATVHLKVAFDWRLTPAYDVIARVRGSAYPDEWIVRGNHHDAWVFGAGDPVSGMVALLEEARAVGALMRAGWRPARSIVYAAWDAEEPGLLGSTEWAEAHADELGRHAVAYINTDGSGRGFLGAGGSHTLERLVSEIAGEVPDPQTGVSVGERLRARLRVDGRREDADRADLELYPLGSGSDYTPFLQHLGIASLNLGYGGESDGGEYHSIYDSFDHYQRFGDPTLAYGVALAKTAGRVTLRLSEAPVLPFRLANLADRVGRYLREVTDLEQRLRDEAEQRNALLARGAYRLAADPTRTSVSPDSLSPVPHLNFAPLQNAVDRLTTGAAAADSALAGALAASPTTRAAMNALLVRTERALTRADGLPRRPWFRHHVYAPGFYTGYGVKTLPGVREALEQRSWAEAETQIEAAAAALDALSGLLAEIVALRPAGS